MRLALCITLCLLSSEALAGIAIPAIAAWVASHTALVIVAQIALTVALSVYGSAKQRKLARKAQEEARRAFNDSLQDRTVTAVTGEAPHRYIYGTARVGSNIVAMFQAGDRDQYKYLVCVHANHECEGIDEVYLNGKAVGPLDGNGDATGAPFAEVSTVGARSGPLGLTNGESHTGPSFSLDHTPIVGGTITIWHNETTGTVPYSQVTTKIIHPFTIVGTAVTLTDGYTGSVKVNYQYNVVTPRVRIRKHLGTPGQAADAMLRADLPDLWPASATLDGICYTVIRIDLNQAEFQSGLFPIEPVIRGKKLYDPRSGLTVWSENNALAIYDYLRSPMCGVGIDDIPQGDIITAANICDTVMPDGLKRYTLNGSVTADDDQSSVLDSMAQSMAGSIVSTTWVVTAGAYTAPVMSLSQSDIIGSLAVNPGISDTDTFNGVRGQFISPENFYVVTDFTPYQDQVYVDADGGKAKWNDLNFPWTIVLNRVHDLCRIETEDQRNSFTVKAEFSFKTWALKVGQRVTFTSSLLGQVDKVYRVTDKVVLAAGPIQLTLKEDAPSIWDQASAATPDDTPNTNIPNPYLVNKIENLQLESGTEALLIQADGTVVSRIHATWDEASTPAVFANGSIEVEWINITDGTAQRIFVAGSETETYLHPVEDGELYDVRARAINVYLNVKSDWKYAATHTVIGKTEPPVSIAEMAINGTVISWTDNDIDKDLAGYVFKFHYGNNTDWNSAALLYDGVITENPYDFEDTLPFGLVTIMAKAVDTSGNESVLAAVIVTNLGDPSVENVVEEISFDPTYVGTKEGCTVSAGDLVSDSLDSFYGTDGQSFYDSDSLSFYESSAYSQMVYTTDEIVTANVLIGSNLTLLIETEGEDVFVEYRFTGPGSFYEADADSFYDGAPSPWLPWPGQIVATVDGLQFRVTIGAGTVQGKILDMALVVDAPDMRESIADVVIGSSPTNIPYTKPFTSIIAIQATLQANLSGAETIEIDKTDPLVPKVLAYNSSHVAVSGAKADFYIEGY